jgi:nuclear pore complex protein Nup155
MQTPPRSSLPGTWLQTPAAKAPVPAPSFSTSVPPNAGVPYTPGSSDPKSKGAQLDHNPPMQQQLAIANPSRLSKDVDQDQRAARAINAALESESRFPELDSYLSRESSKSQTVPDRLPVIARSC